MNNSKMWLGVALCALLGCSDKDGPRLPVVGDDPRAVENGLLFLDDDAPQAYLLDVTKKEPKVKQIDLPAGAKLALQRPGQKQDQVVVLTSGLAAVRGDGENQPEVEAHVLVIAAAGEPALYPLGSRFENLTLSDDGRYGVAYAPSAGFSFGTSIAVVDLDMPPLAGSNPRLINVTSLDGQVPNRFVFSPEAQVAGEKRRFLITLSTNDINLIDLGHLERGEVTIPLTLGNTGESFDPEQLVFAGDQIYLQSRGASDVLVIQLTETTLQANRHGFAVSLLSLPVGDSLQGIALLGTGDAQRLLALSSRGGRVIDPRTGNGVDLDLSGSYTHAITFKARSPSDDTLSERAVLYGKDSRIAFMDLSENGSAIASSVEEIPLNQDVTSALPLIERKQLVLTHDGDQVSLVDLEERTVSPLTLGTQVDVSLLDGERARLWITTADGSLGTLDLKTLAPSRILLDADAKGLVPIRGKRALMAVIHPSESGFVTLLDADKPNLDDATSLLGFLWNGILE